VASVLGDWTDAVSPGTVTGFSGGMADQGSGGVQSGVQSAVTAQAGAAPLWSPDNPLFWFGAILAVVAGAITLSSTVDFGPLKGKARI